MTIVAAHPSSGELLERERSRARRVPDFIIAGGQKCGTTSLHHILNAHPAVALPESEIGYFDLDDFEQHPDFFTDRDGRWTTRDFDADHDRWRAWYESFFTGCEAADLVGEDSPSYLASRKAPDRIRRELPNVRLVFLLRDPASRTYSHYWHLLATGRATLSFEDTLRFEPGQLVSRSVYAPRIAAYREAFPPDRVKVVLFEEFVSEQDRVVSEVCEFLGLDGPPDLSRTRTHRNRSFRSPVPGLQRWWNYARRGRWRTRYAAHLEQPPQSTKPDAEGDGRRSGLRPRLAAGAKRALDHPWLKRATKVPPMQPETRRFLDDLLRRENTALPDLLGRDLDRHWYHSRERNASQR